MPRRVYEYADVGHLEIYNLISTIGSFILGAGILVTVFNAVRSAKNGVDRRPGPVEGEHARVVHDLAAAGQQLRRRPARALGRADEGHPPPGRAPDRARPTRRRPRPARVDDPGLMDATPTTPRAAVAPAAARQVAGGLRRAHEAEGPVAAAADDGHDDARRRRAVGRAHRADVPRRLPVGRRRGRGQPLVRPRRRRADGAHGGPPGRVGPRVAARGARVRLRARRALVRAECR